ncbi:MAG TPA: disulfide bond formation protein B [Burkholderiales bacterium]|nr:disulfide bond formation protein B [Burkholderiales bacterium]
MINIRLIYLAIFVACAGLLGFGLYLQHVEHLDPCPLCILQRIAFIATGVTAVVAAVHNPQRIGNTIYALTMTIFAGIGAGIAGWHVWLQYTPRSKVVECGPGLEYMLDAFPLSKALPMIFRGSGDCGFVVWSFLGLSIPAWALVWFILIALAGMILLIQTLRQRKDATA